MCIDFTTFKKTIKTHLLLPSLTYANKVKTNSNNSDKTIRSTDSTTQINIHNINPNPKLTATIENIPKDKLNQDFLNTLLLAYNIDKSTITQTKFTKAFCFITFTTLYAKDSFTRIKLKETSFDYLFIHDLLIEQSRLKYLYYHAIKSGKITDYKCTLNLRNNTYEIRRRLTNNKTDWTSPPLNPTTDQLNDWSESLDEFRKKQIKD